MIKHQDCGSLQKNFLGLSESEFTMAEQRQPVADTVARAAAEGSHTSNHKHEVEMANWKWQEF